MHYVAKETLFDDYIFSIGYYLTLQSDGESSNMFPSFKDSVIDGDSKSNSRVALAFERAWAGIYATAKEYLDDVEELGAILEGLNAFSMQEISEKLVAHGAKKYGIQKLGDLLTTSVQDISMRGGWALKTFNTFFDYWVGSFASSVRTGKCMSGWTTTDNQTYHGGFPPDLNDITVEKSKVNAFVKALMGRHENVSSGLPRFLLRTSYVIGMN